MAFLLASRRRSADRLQGQQTLEVKNLRRRLVLLDSLALTLAWSPALTWKFFDLAPLWKLAVIHAGLIVSGLALLKVQGLYLSRVASSRDEELRRLVQATLVLGFVQWVLLSVLSVFLPWQAFVGSPVLLLVFLMWFRGGYRAWLSAARAQGLYLRDVLVIGTNDDAAALVTMLAEHPESGFRVVGVIGDHDAARDSGLDPLHLGTPDDAVTVLDQLHVTGVIAVAGALPPLQLMELLSHLERQGIHIQLSTGLHGMSHRRLRATPIAYQSLYYVEPIRQSNVQMYVKRALDLLVAGVCLLVFAVPMAAIALAIKLTDHGPVLFRQTRVGRDGKHFAMFKFRSMVVDAEARLAALVAEAGNERHGPLFKLEHDPRVTRIGRFIRATSLDELPQLLNVIRGEMSIVGPRPALPSEVSQFDERLLDRLRMPPGITGLWQVEARDNPHFGAYRRLDLFYVDNWSLNLDLVILVATVEQVLSKAIRTLVPSRDRGPAAGGPVVAMPLAGPGAVAATPVAPADTPIATRRSA